MIILNWRPLQAFVGGYRTANGATEQSLLYGVRLSIPDGELGTKLDASDARCIAGNWADLKEDRMINPARCFGPIFGPLGPTAGPGNPGTAPARQIVQFAPKFSSGGRFGVPFAVSFCFWDRPQTYKNINDNIAILKRRNCPGRAST